jgi:hypothetical protein
MRYGFNGMNKIGKATENLFALYAPQIGWTRAEQCESKSLDIFSHIDQVYTDKNGTIIKVQIKDMRHEFQGGPEIDDSICIELVNVNGNSGSANGKYNYFIHRIKNKFLVYNKEKIDLAISKLVEFSFVKEFKLAKNKLYRRKNRNDTTTLLVIADLEKLGINPEFEINISDSHTATISNFYYKCVNTYKNLGGKNV